MANTREYEILLNLLDTARNLPAPSLEPLSPNARPLTADGPVPHPIDDEDLLLDWSMGDLSPERHRQLLAHLAACPACRREIAAMVRAGALVLPEVDETDGDDSTADSHDAVVSFPDPRPVSERPAYVAPAPRAHPWRHRTVFALVLALAASLLVMLARGLFESGPRAGGTPIALAHSDLQQGRVREAFTRIDDYLSRAGELTAGDRREAAAILESSGYELARGGLVAGDFRRVSEIENRVASRTGGSSRLLNLRIQAERGETAEQSLSRRMSLVRDYGYEPNGQRLIKDLMIPEITATHRRIEAELSGAVRTYPDAVDLQLNYGQFLMEQNDFQGAEVVFAEVLRSAPENALAHTGLGLALFQQNRPETIKRAVESFQKAVALWPDDPEVNLNLAVCLMRQGRAAEARPYFQKANMETK